MKKRIFLILLFSILYSIFPMERVMAFEVRVSDSAGILSTEENSVMEQNLGYIEERYQSSVYLITSDAIGKKGDYEEILKTAKKSAEEKNLLLLFISTKKKEECCSIQPYGAAKKNLTKNRLKKIESSVEKKLKKEEYTEALQLLYDRLLEQMGTKPVSDAFLFQPVFHLILCILLTVGAMFLFLHQFDDKKHLKKVPYLNEKYSTMLGTLDHFSHTSIKPVKKKKGKKPSLPKRPQNSGEGS